MRGKEERKMTVVDRSIVAISFHFTSLPCWDDGKDFLKIKGVCEKGKMIKAEDPQCKKDNCVAVSLSTSTTNVEYV